MKGVYLNGARWDRVTRQLAEQLPKIIFDPMPIIWIFPIRKEHLKTIDFYMSPLYITSERRGTLSTTGNNYNIVLNISFYYYFLILKAIVQIF